MLNRAGIEALVPHAGSMCLLDAVDGWDARSLICRTQSHRRVDNPLRSRGQLSAIHLIEYAAQAAAVHGGLLGVDGDVFQSGAMLAAVREFEVGIARLDTLEDALVLSATRLVANANGWLYEFSVRSGERQLARGRLSVIRATGGAPPRPALAE